MDYKFAKVNDDEPRTLYEEQKIFVMHKISELMDISIKDIHIDNVNPMGWQAIIRTDKLDLVFSYYEENCWKIETFPVYALSNDMLRSKKI